MYEDAKSYALAAQGGMVGGQIYPEKMEKLTVRDNINEQIERAQAEVARLEGIRDRLAPELLDQRIADLQQAMRF